MSPFGLKYISLSLIPCSPKSAQRTIFCMHNCTVSKDGKHYIIVPHIRTANRLLAARKGWNQPACLRTKDSRGLLQNHKHIWWPLQTTATEHKQITSVPCIFQLPISDSIPSVAEWHKSVCLQLCKYLLVVQLCDLYGVTESCSPKCSKIMSLPLSLHPPIDFFKKPKY